MKILVIDAVDLLYPEGQTPPSADPIPGGVDFARRVAAGYSTSFMVVSSTYASVEGLRDWLKTFDIRPAWVLAEWEDNEPGFIEMVLQQTNRLHASIALFLSGNAGHVRKMAAHRVPGALYLPASEGVLDWRTPTSTWEKRVGVDT